MESILPSSANWYCSRIIDSNEEGIVIIGAKNALDIWDSKVAPVRHVGNFIAHQERIVGVSLCRTISNDSPRCCTAAEDGSVRVWNLNSSEPIKEHCCHKNKLTTIHWSPIVNSQLIASGDEKGCIVLWNVSLDEKTIWHSEPAHKHIFCLTFSPREANLLAVGYKTGAVVILDVGKKVPFIVHRLRGHDDEIHCICWSPSDETDLSCSTAAEEADRNQMLATSCRDKTVRLWNLVTGQTVTTLKLPSSGGTYPRQRSEEHASKMRVWTALCWPHIEQIVTSGLSGEVLVWDISDLGEPRSHLIRHNSTNRGHSRIVFSIAAGGENLNTLTSVSMDRQMIIWDLSNMCVKQSISSLGGFAYAIATSPLNPDRVAVGSGDCLIRVWNLSNAQSLNVQTYWQGINAKVTALNWHPRKEGSLAYGTEDGRVGVYDILSPRPPLKSGTFHEKTVNAVLWGPECYASDDSAIKKSDEHFCLYSVGDGVIYQHNMNSVHQPAVNIDSIIAVSNSDVLKRCQVTSPSSHSAMAWTDDYSHVAIGNEDGNIDVYKTPNLKIVCKLLVHKKLITCLRWHPEYTVESDSEKSMCRLWLAAGSIETVIHVFDLYRTLCTTTDGCLSHDGCTLSLCDSYISFVKARQSCRDDVALCVGCRFASFERPVMLTESLRQLDGHTHRVTSLCWSTHRDGFLASASFDGTSQVWDVKSGTRIAVYSGHNGRLFCVEWSASDADVMFTGSDDHTVRVWHLSQNAWTEGNDKKKIKQKIASKTKKTSVKSPTDSSTLPGDRRTNSTSSSRVSAGNAITRSSGSSPADTVTKSSMDSIEDALDNICEASRPAPTLSQDDAKELRQLLDRKRTELAKFSSPEADSSSNSAVGDFAVKTQLHSKANKDMSNIECNSIAVQAEDMATQDAGVRDRDIEGSSLNESGENCFEFGDDHVVSVDDDASNYYTAVFDSSRRDINRDKRKRRTKSLFPKSSMADNRGKLLTQQDCVELAKFVYTKGSVDDLPESLLHLGCFVNRRYTYSLYKQEESHHIDNGNIDQFVTLQVFKGRDISSCISERHLPLTDYYLALCNNQLDASKQEMYERYAKLLEADGLYHKAATIYLINYQVYEAISVLENNGLYKDAVCLAQVRLSPRDPVINQLFTAWAGNLAKDGNYELAAKCYLAMSMAHKAAGSLVKRSERNALRSAILILVAAQLFDDAKVFVQKYVQECVLQFDWLAAEEVIRLHPSFNTLAVKLVVYRTLATHLASTDSLQSVVNGIELLTCADDEHLFTRVVNSWQKEWGINTTEKDGIQNYCSQLQIMQYTKQSQPSVTQVLSEVSLHVTLSIFQLLLHNLDEAFGCLAEAVQCCLHAQYTDLAFGLCQLVQPAGSAYSDLLSVINKLSGIEQPTVAFAVETRDCEQPIKACHGQCTTLYIFQAYRALATVEHFVGQSAKASCKLVKSLKLNITEISQALLWNVCVDRAATNSKTLGGNSRTTETVIDNISHNTTQLLDDVKTSDHGQLHSFGHLIFPDPLRSAPLLLQFVDILLKTVDRNSDVTVANDLTDNYNRVQQWVSSHTLV